MKKLLFLIFFSFSFLLNAQLDREHWFAPMYDGQSNSGDEQFLHLSTNETTPFNVKVYSNNILVAQKNISKGNPGVIEINQFPNANEIDRESIITNNVFQLHKVINKGLYIKADKPCFANLRFGVTNHTEIITSKGTAGIGTKFYTVVAPSAQTNPSISENLGFAASFLATEDNTRVTVNNFKKPLTFNNYGTATSFTFILNKGESYIIDGRISNLNNRDGFIGAEVNSDKPISMSNGNFNGQYASTINGDGSDILMDQSVPVDKLGDEFVIVKGYGIIGNKMEGAIIVATEPNTAIYLNDAAIPTIILANPGDFYKAEETSYIDRGNQHYNLHIVTDKNVYVYQLLAGVASGSAPLATGGMNYIPPLNCYLPKKIDEISYINYLSNVPHNPPFSTKLNIITEKNAVVKVNGIIPSTLYGPYDISTIAANQNWVSYSVPNVTGNITVESTKAVTAGIASGNSAFGYGGYFAGFSAIPLIQKVQGSCLNQSPEVKLAVTEGFEIYQWLIKQTDGTYINAPIPPLHPSNTAFEYYPTQAGIYAVKVKQGTCPEIQTPDKEFFNCDTYTNYDYKSCGKETITPIFTFSTQTVNPASVILTVPPTKGTVATNPDGTIILDATGKFNYTAFANASGIDRFKYLFKGIGAIPDSEEAQITVIMIERNDALLQECSTNGFATYNLTLADVSTDTDLTKTYFKTQNGVLNDIAADRINNFTTYPSADGFVYVRIKNSINCIAVAKIELKSKLAPEVKENLYIKLHCDEDIDQKIDGIYKVDLTTITPIVLVQASNFVVKYYADQPKAISGLPADVLTGIFSFTVDTKVWIRVDAPNGCSPVIKEIQLKTGPKFTVNDPITVFECDDNLNNSESTFLSNYNNLFTTDPTASVNFYATFANAQNNTPTTTDKQTITTPRSFYYRFTKAGFCDVIGTLNISLKPSTPTALLDSYSVCAGSSINLEAEQSPIYNKWEWKQGTTVLFTNYKATLFAGVYTISFTNASGCIFTKNITVKDSPKPILNTALYTATPCDSNFDGESDSINFNTISPIIVTNFNANPLLYKVRYYLNKTDRNAGNNNNITNFTNWTFSAPTTVYVRAESQYCPYIEDASHEIHFKFGTPLPLIQNPVTTPVCDSDLSNSEEIKLDSYKTLFTTSTGVTVKYFDDLIKAQNNVVGDDIGANQIISGDETYYLRFKKTGFCDNIGTLNIDFKQPKKSTVLLDKQICPGTTTTLDAGPGFNGYLWSTGETTQSINVPVGDYYVDLLTNGCTYRQNVSVKAVELPKIVSVEIVGSTVTVTATGGNPPYQYAIDGNNYQSSNVFTNVRGGDHTISVISADNCEPATAEINVIELYNTITPNNDGINDVFNYSALLNKNEPFLQIYDRYGKLVFTGDKNNSYSWDGKTFGKLVSTGSYWYVMKWKEPGFDTVTEYSGWVLVKNRE